MDIFPKKKCKWPTGTQKVFNITNHQGSEKIQSEISPHVGQMAIIKTTKKRKKKKKQLTYA